MAAVRRPNPQAQNGDDTDQRALLSLMDQPARTTMPVPVDQPPTAAPPDTGTPYTPPVDIGTGASVITGGANSGIAATAPNSVGGGDVVSAPNSVADLASASSPGSGGSMLGFDMSRLESAKDSPKYAFANLAKDLAPTDANMQLIAQKLGTGVGHLDDQNNFMLDKDAGGYIGVRDRGNGPQWQWMAYNDAHPGPHGEGNPGYVNPDASGGATGTGTITGSSALDALTSQSTYQKLLQYLQQMNGAPATDQDALLSQMTA